MKGKKTQPRRAKAAPRPPRSPTLKQLAEHLGLSPATVSIALNGGPNSGLAVETQRVIRQAAREMGYRPNFLARWLRTRKSYILGVLIPEVSQGYNVQLLRGLEDYLVSTEYFYFAASHHNRPEVLEEYAYKLVDRAVDGLIVISAPWKVQVDVPVVVVSSHHVPRGTAHVMLDHAAAAEIGLRHLMDLGHRRIAFIVGPPRTPDSAVRWKAITEAAGRLGLPIAPKLVATITDETPSSPTLGFEVTRQLLAAGEPFTALWAFNDITALGAISVLQERGLRVPQDVSVLGFDDIELASLQHPRLSTIRQPLQQMGRMAAETLVSALASGARAKGEAVIRPELVVRESTIPVAAQDDAGRRWARP